MHWSKIVKTKMPDGTWTVGCVRCRMSLGQDLSDAGADAAVWMHDCARTRR